MTLQATINRIFGEGGWLEACKGLRHEPAQHSYALDVCDWLTGDEAAPIGLIEGETGVGKTLGYLIPLMVHLAQTGHRGAVATHTIHLQSQIIEGDLLVAKECLSYLNLPHVSVQQVIGRHHFLDPERLERVIRYCLSEGDHLPHAEQLIRGAYRISRGSSLLADFLREYGPLPDHITGDDICVGPRSDAGGMEAFDAQLAAAKKAQLVITSHTMTLLNRRYRHGSAGIFESEDQPLAYLVVDEADLLEAAAESFSSLRRHPRQLANVFAALRPLATGGATKRALDELDQSASALGAELRSFDPGGTEGKSIVFGVPGAQRLEASVDAAIEKMSACTSTILRAAARNRDKADQPLEFALSEAEATSEFISRYLNRHDTGSAIWGVSWSPIQRQPSIEMATPFPAKTLRRYWVDDAMPVRTLLTSATLSNGRGGSFGNIKGAIRTFSPEKYAVESAYAPASFGRVSYVLPDPSIPNPYIKGDDDTGMLNEHWLRYAAAMIDAAAAQGNALVLTRSFAETSRLAKLLTGANVHAHVAGSALSDHVAHFRAHGGVLITPSAWQGISLRTYSGKQLFSELVITRLPYRPPRPYYEKALLQHLQQVDGLPRTQAEAIYRGHRAVQVVRELRQGMGRLIRNASDAGTIWVADPRFPPPRGAVKHSAFQGLASCIAPRFLSAYQQAQVFTYDSGLTAPTPIPEKLMEWL